MSQANSKYTLMSDKVNVARSMTSVTGYWEPRIAAELNGQHVKLAKFKGEFVWHKHDAEDEMFYVIKGSFDMHFRDRIVTIGEGEFIVVPRGVEHKPVAADEVSVMLFEPASTVNTGNVENELTKRDLKTI